MSTSLRTSICTSLSQAKRSEVVSLTTPTEICLSVWFVSLFASDGKITGIDFTEARLAPDFDSVKSDRSGLGIDQLLVQSLDC